jgi:hypothetical protein
MTDATVVQDVSCVDHHGWNCLHSAALQSDSTLIVSLLNHPNVNINVETLDGHRWTTLHVAV